MTSREINFETLVAFVENENLPEVQRPAWHKDIEHLLENDPQQKKVVDAIRLLYARHPDKRTKLAPLLEQYVNAHKGERAGYPNDSPGNVIKFSVRVTAIVVLLLVAGLAVLYTTTSYKSLYKTHLVLHQAPSSALQAAMRGSAPPHTVPKTSSLVTRYYAEKHYKAAVKMYEQIPAQAISTEEAFFAGNAYLSLSQPQKAIACLEKALHSNTYRQKAEWYLALAYLGNHQATPALEYLQKIRSNENHPFYKNASGMLYCKTLLLSKAD